MILNDCPTQCISADIMTNTVLWVISQNRCLHQEQAVLLM